MTEEGFEIFFIEHNENPRPPQIRKCLLPYINKKFLHCDLKNLFKVWFIQNSILFRVQFHCYTICTSVLLKYIVTVIYFVSFILLLITMQKL